MLKIAIWKLEKENRNFYFHPSILLKHFYHYYYIRKISGVHKHFSHEPFIWASHTSTAETWNQTIPKLNGWSRQPANLYVAEFSRLLISFMKYKLLVGLGRGASLMIFQCHQNYILKWSRPTKFKHAYAWV